MADRGLIGGIAGISPGTRDRRLMQQLVEAILSTRGHRHRHAGAREPPDQGKAKSWPDADHYCRPPIRHRYLPRRLALGQDH